MALLYTSPLPSPSLHPKTHFPAFTPSFLSLVFSPSALHNNIKQRRRSRRVVASASDATTGSVERPNTPGSSPKLRILIAGGGIGGLVFALAAKRKGFDVLVFEKDISAIRGEGQYRGPIQIQSNALAALEAIDPEVAEEVMEVGCITGDRINGLVDGITGTW